MGAKAQRDSLTEGFHLRLAAWYRAHGRKALPWRNTRDAYAIYVSEIMLQQTQIKTVLERFYGPFLARFPDLQSLAEAQQEEVLSAWQGLGYYSRALNLHRVAKACPDGLPDTVEELMALPGIGRNTAHAVAAFAFGKPQAVMEANVKRVICRLFALENPAEAELWEKAGQLLNTQDAFDYNQAMMDLGAMVCTRRQPACGQCPANAICQGKSAPGQYPAAKKAKPAPVRRQSIWALRDDKGRYYLEPRETRFLQGLYRFAQTEAGADSVMVRKRRYLRENATPLGQIRQQYSHFMLEADVLLVEAGKGQGKGWHAPDAFAGLPVSMAECKVAGLLGLPQGVHKKPFFLQRDAAPPLKVSS